LGIRVTDYSYAAVTAEFGQVGFELRSEISILQAVDRSPESLRFIVENQARPLGTQVGVIVCSIIYIVYTILFGDRSEEAAHYANSFRFVVGLKLGINTVIAKGCFFLFC
jgi:hypothetical protein